LAENITEIIQSPFGNYAITEALEAWDDKETVRPIINKLKEYFL